MDQDTVSIIVRTMGRPELARAIESIKRQSYQNVQTVLVVANPEYSPHAYSADPRTAIVRTGSHLNRPSAANAGLATACGSWIGFLDEDDWFEPNHVSSLMDALRACPGFRLAYSDLALHEGADLKIRDVGYWKRRQCDSPAISIISMLFSRAMCDRFACRFDPDFQLLEDWDFIVQCSEFTDFLHCHGATAHYDTTAGTSGCGMGKNRDYERFKPYLEKMTRKWGVRYRGLIEGSDRCEKLAREAFQKSNYSSVDELVSRGLMLDPGNPRLLNLMAMSRFRQQDAVGALVAQRRACDSDQRSFPLLRDLVLLAHQLGSAGEARQGFVKLRQLAVSEMQRVRLREVASLIAYHDIADHTPSVDFQGEDGANYAGGATGLP